MTERTVIIPETAVMDAGRLALLVQRAGAFSSEIYLDCRMRHVNCKSLMGTMTLGMTVGETVKITATGEDEADAADSLGAFLEA